MPATSPSAMAVRSSSSRRTPRAWRGAAVLADLAQIVDRADCILVSPGISSATAERLGFRHAPTPKDALTMAFERQGSAAGVVVLRYGGRILPKIDNASES